MAVEGNALDGRRSLMGVCIARGRWPVLEVQKELKTRAVQDRHVFFSPVHLCHGNGPMKTVMLTMNTADASCTVECRETEEARADGHRHGVQFTNFAACSMSTELRLGSSMMRGVDWICPCSNPGGRRSSTHSDCLTSMSRVRMGMWGARAWLRISSIPHSNNKN